MSHLIYYLKFKLKVQKNKDKKLKYIHYLSKILNSIISRFKKIYRLNNCDFIFINV